MRPQYFAYAKAGHSSPQTTNLWRATHTRWHTLSLRVRRATTALVTAALALGGMALVAAPAYATTQSNVPYINSSGTATTTATATVLDSTVATLATGWTYCNSTLTHTIMETASSGTMNLILGDNCNLTMTATSRYDSGIWHDGGTLNIYSQANNTGRMTLKGANQGAGLRVRYGTVNIYGGFISATGGDGSAGIGAREGFGVDSGTIKIAGRASVTATGGKSTGAAGGGAGIGGGGSSSGSTLGGGTISISTTGLVRAFRGADGGGGYAPGAAIGTGGCYGNGCYSNYINTVTVNTPSITGSATVTAESTPLEGTSPSSVTGVAVGSRMIWKSVPATGYQINTHSSSLVAVAGNLFVQDISTSTSPQTSSISYWRTTTMALSASPTSQQTRPGNVVLTANLKVGSTNLASKSVGFYEGTTLLGSGNTDSFGNTSITLTSPTAGNKSYQAKFDADTTYGPSSATLSYSVVNPTPVITIDVSPAGQQQRPGNVTITANAKVTGTNINALSLQLYVNDVAQLPAVQTNQSGNAVFTHTAPPLGTYSYQVKWTGNTTYPAADSTLITGYQVIRGTQNALTLAGLGTSYTYGDAPLSLTTGGGSGNGDVTLTSSNPTVASLSGTTTAGAGILTLNRAGTFSITQTKAQDNTYDQMVRVTPTTTVAEAVPVATLTRTGGETFATPVNATLQVHARGVGTTPQGYVQFYQRTQKLGDPLPLVNNGDGTASVSLNGIPLTHMGAQIVTAEFLGETGKYKTVSKIDEWYLGNLGYCKVETPEA